MPTTPAWATIARDEALTRGLGDEEARVLVEWLVEQAEALEAEGTPGDWPARLAGLCRRARGIVRFVRLWCHEASRGAALQLAAAERFEWPLPTRRVEAADLMQRILKWESRHRQKAAA